MNHPTNNTFEDLRNEILVEDIILMLSPALEEYDKAIHQFIETSMDRGFDRKIVEHSLLVFKADIAGIIAIAEDSLSVLNSAKADILRRQLQSHKDRIRALITVIEKIILEEPRIDRQLLLQIENRRVI